MTSKTAAKIPVDKQGRISAAERKALARAIRRAAYGLTLAEKRLVIAAAAQNPDAATLVRVSAKEYAQTFKIETNTAYGLLSEAAERLFRRAIGAISTAQPAQAEQPPSRWGAKFRWTTRCEYLPDEGAVKIRFTHELIAALPELIESFTPRQLQQKSAMRSAYSWRLLELIHKHMERYENAEWAEFEIGEFANAMQASPSQRRNFAFMRRRVIEPAVAELVEKEGWNIQWETVSQGQKVIALRFSYRGRGAKKTQARHK